MLAHLDFGDRIVILDPRAISVEISDDSDAQTVRVRLTDGRVVEWPLAWSTRLAQATPAERANARIVEDGRAVEWPDAGEYLKVAPMMLAEGDGQPEQGDELTADQLASCPFCRQKRPIERLPDGDASMVRATYVSPDPLIRGITFARGTGEILYTRVSSIQTADAKVHPLDLRVPMGRRSCEKCDTMPKLEDQLRLLDKRRIRASIARRRYHEMRMVGPIPKIDRMAIYARDNGVCHLCGKPADVNDFHLDHVVPLSLGGTHTEDNLKVAHPSCNKVKGGRRGDFCMKCGFAWADHNEDWSCPR